ncbi:uncharacterized protein Z520_01672 [Fonsecaea multimorphosa CBS 102226]|uniref:Fumarylacetoacetase-like C-terminal domain-containing protein n=1 Tax=Fonsecaea multimorphosa CBS 102226 TaxID=1442371 RepID=A0A0D2KI98_9EURO|nr:uncharacterized protein Z520_01672 [Fonsecaea multimorphosa CBS 102226]KIY03205.1 hypothetical protein Z520_01672 [Fonsecaea multimorphosa CBS 102226]OAL30446.1 hypothetical protein AYO22_01644 [Fonsecaea multimorphosa]
MVQAKFSRLVRFIADDDTEYYGDAGESTDGSFSTARVIEGNIFDKFEVTSNVKKIKKLVAPLNRSTTHIVRGFGVAYKGVPEKMGFKFPEYPVLFYKPVTAIIGPFDDVPIDLSSQDDGLDCEVELVVVIGKEALNVPEEDALKYVLGYTVGNDMTHHGWMRKGNRMGALGKNCDGWCPIGPCIIPTDAVEDVQKMRLWTKINGELIQDGSTKDMIFSIARLVSFSSQGTTLLPGDIILTGTPLGARAVLNPPIWLHDGDVMELGIEKIGTIKNKITFKK